MYGSSICTEQCVRNTLKKIVDLEKTYDMNGRDALWKVNRRYDVGTEQLEAVRMFFKIRRYVRE